MMIAMHVEGVVGNGDAEGLFESLAACPLADHFASY
jgi:hypothetical protein